MADFAFNIVKGRAVELFNRVDANDPAASALYVIPVQVSAVTDATIKDFDDFAAIIAGGVTERSANGWNRKTLTDTDIAFGAPDDVNDRYPIDFADQTWTPTSGTDTVSDLIVCYASVASPTNAQLLPISQHDFIITPDGSLVTCTVNDFYWAT